MRKTILIAALILAIMSGAAWAGTTGSKGFIYKPDLGAKGNTEKSLFDAGLDRIDARLGKETWLGDPGGSAGYDTLAHALTSIGSIPTILRVPAGTTSITADTVIPANITLKPERGAIFAIATAKTLTINGTLEAGLYQIFSCADTHSIDLSGAKITQAYPQWFGATADGATDDTDAVRTCIDSLCYDRTVQDYGTLGYGPRGRGEVYFSSGIYIVQNILLRTGVSLYGPGILKLKDGMAVVGMPTPRGPSNVLCTTLNHDGDFTDYTYGPQTWSDAVGTTTWKSEGAQVAFIATDVNIELGGIDGNRTNNNMPDQAGVGYQNNTTAAGINLSQVFNVTISKTPIYQCRIDGVAIGYSENGGSYYCSVNHCLIYSIGRYGVALLTGWRNHVINNYFQITGLLYGVQLDIDIEPNKVGEVCSENVVSGNIGGGRIHIGSASTIAKLWRNQITGNKLGGDLVLHPCSAGGTNITANSFIGNGTLIAMALVGNNSNAIVALESVNITGNEFYNYASGISVGINDSIANVLIKDNSFKKIGSVAGNGVLFDLLRPYNIQLINNSFEDCGHASTPDTLFLITYSATTTYPNQGKNNISGNVVRTSHALTSFVRWSWGSDYPDIDNIFDAVEDNKVYGPYTTAILFDNTPDANPAKLSIKGNIFNAKLSQSSAPTGTWMYMPTSVSCKAHQLFVENNTVIGYATGINLVRPFECRFVGNNFNEVQLGMLFTYDDTNYLTQGGNVYNNNILAPGGTSTYGMRLTGTSANTYTAPDSIVGNVVIGSAVIPAFATANYLKAAGVTHTTDVPF